MDLAVTATHGTTSTHKLVRIWGPAPSTCGSMSPTGSDCLGGKGLLVSMVPKGWIRLLRDSLLGSGHWCDSPMRSKAKRLWISHSPKDSQEKERGHRKSCRLRNTWVSLQELCPRAAQMPPSRRLSCFPLILSCTKFSFPGSSPRALTAVPQSPVAAHPCQRAAGDPRSLCDHGTKQTFCLCWFDLDFFSIVRVRSVSH